MGTFQVHSPQPLARGTATLYTFLALLLLLLALTFRMIRPYLLAILMGGILAVLTEKAYRILLKYRIRPHLASLIVTLAILFLILAPISAFVLIALRQATGVGEVLSGTQLPSLRSMIEVLSDWAPVRFWIGDPIVVEEQIRKGIQSLVTHVTSALLSFAANLPSIFLQILLACLSCFFLLIDGRRFILWATNKVPIDWDVRMQLIESFKSTAISVIMASIVSATVQALLIFLSFLILDVPLAFLGASATFILSWVPIIGSSPIWISAIFYFYFRDEIFQVLMMLMLGILISISDNFVRPWIIRGRGSLHPLVTLVAIFGGIQMFGYVGVFVGPILMAILISLLQVWPDVAERFGLVLEDGVPRKTSTPSSISIKTS